MANRKTKQAPVPTQQGITRITVGNFKSITGEQSIRIRPLTILAGANSSGKSSMMQPLLLLKQTLEAPYDPGALLLNGPNVRFTSAEQLLSRHGNAQSEGSFLVGFDIETRGVKTILKQGKWGGFEVKETAYMGRGNFHFSKDMSSADILEQVRSLWFTDTSDAFFAQPNAASLLQLVQNRCFLNVRAKDYPFIYGLPDLLIGTEVFIDALHKLIHLPGLRGNPARTYPLTPIGPNFVNFAGTFENYVASVISFWQANNAQTELQQLNQDLHQLGLTNKIVAHPQGDALIELVVNRLLSDQNGTEDMVNIADVGFGVSQVLPILVALRVAEPGQLIYIEQPELHLHPRAQSILAEILANAALQGKRMVIETHSSLLLLGIQTLVAEKKLPSALVILHWFTQQADGSTHIISAELDQAGAYGNWPEDFDTTILQAENRYLNAAEAQLMGE